MSLATVMIVIFAAPSISSAFELPSDGASLTSCHLPTGTPALCVELDRCKQLLGLIGNLVKPIPGDVALLIRDSYFCPEEEGKDGIHVCCPVDGIDPKSPNRPTTQKRDSCGMQDPSVPATCTLYNNCSPFLQLVANVQRPIPPELVSIMRSGWMCGLERSPTTGTRLPKICCPTAALVDVPLDLHPNIGLLPPQDECGLRQVQELRIVGGQDAEVGQFPWLANLGYQKDGEGEVQFKCGGAMISERYVLTAAHCVINLPGGFQLTRIRVGEHTLSTDPDCSLGGSKSRVCSTKQDFDVEKIIPHEEYNSPNRFQNDIALVRLASPGAALNDFVTPICLPFADAEEESYILETEESRRLERTRVAGWGATTVTGRNPADVLQWLGVNVTESSECRATYAERGATLTPLSQMCAGGEKDKDSCVGDSGSALMREDPGVLKSPWRIVGVVSFGPRRCGTEGVPGVYTRIRFYLQWILDQLEP